MRRCIRIHSAEPLAQSEHWQQTSSGKWFCMVCDNTTSELPVGRALQHNEMKRHQRNVEQAEVEKRPRTSVRASDYQTSGNIYSSSSIHPPSHGVQLAEAVARQDEQQRIISDQTYDIHSSPSTNPLSYFAKLIDDKDRELEQQRATTGYAYDIRDSYAIDPLSYIVMLMKEEEQKLERQRANSSLGDSGADAAPTDDGLPGTSS